MINSAPQSTVMTRNDLAVALHHDRAEVEAAVKNLEDPGFDLQNLSMIDRRSGRRCDRWGMRAPGSTTWDSRNQPFIDTKPRSKLASLSR